ncbi:type IX secretion system membrane protein PorP/SprF [Fulvivirgaceae bacterium BMA12]|uniref:Type IX secretion system membrane protein PorP/SprF n=1 Tax=Agaribacillus aureus TaxID=3051825 RepID=A0ABT8LI71_9BACT|nr:type IX secretion system membrane protein PorP/SprF [Fulvivirgaceae bacterium BMA12]
MKKITKLLLGLVLLMSVGPCYAQQQVMFTQYMFNGMAINPGYAGSHETMSITALLREQWSGLDGAPSTQTLSAHAPIKDQKFGLGVLFMHDKIGVTDQNGAYGAYSYKIPFSNESKLSLGLQAGFTHYNARYSQISDTDPKFARGDIRETHFNFGFGAYYYSDRFYLGFSIPQMINRRFDRNAADSDSKLVRHYFLTYGYVLDLNSSLKFKPNMLVKMVEGAPVEVDLNANLLINEVLWVGLSWRSFDSFDGLVQLQLTDQLQLGYAYDFATTSELRRVNSGSHEVMLNYRFTFTRSRVVTPRYF